MAYKAYYITPIDFGWEFTPTVKEFAELLAKHDAKVKLQTMPYGEARLDQFAKDFKEAQSLATEVGWEGDFRGDPHVFTLPREGEIAYGFVWKQDNNGDTLVVAPEPLRWLDQHVLR